MKMPRHQKVKQKVRDQEACRVTLIYCRDLLNGLREKLSNAIPDGTDPHGVAASWLGSADANIANLIAFLVENEL